MEITKLFCNNWIEVVVLLALCLACAIIGFRQARLLSREKGSNAKLEKALSIFAGVAGMVCAAIILMMPAAAM